MGPHFPQPRSYGRNPVQVQRLAAWSLLALVLQLLCRSLPRTAAERPVNIVVLGDSLTARALACPRKTLSRPSWQRALKAKGISAKISNAGVSGDTASGGLGRLDWSVPRAPTRSLSSSVPTMHCAALDPRSPGPLSTRSCASCTAPSHCCACSSGMRAPPNMGPDYTRDFDAIYPALASTHPRRLLSVLPRWRGRRSQTEPGGRHASECRRCRRDREAASCRWSRS